MNNTVLHHGITNLKSAVQSKQGVNLRFADGHRLLHLHQKVGTMLSVNDCASFRKLKFIVIIKAASMSPTWGVAVFRLCN